jgi:glycosyltransferase involved in cell wall biosynthesis/predicted O-methyltransferase YrrM
MDLCYEFEDYDLGERASKLYMENNDFDMLMYSWFSIYQLLNKMPKIKKEINIPEKPIICFLIDGNWNPWTGKDIEFRGLGGSETFVVEMARNMKKINEKLDIYVFCKCSREEEYEGVHYMDIKKYLNFVQENLVHTCIINRYSEYIPVTYKTNVENVYLVVHDTEPTGNIIISHPKLKNIILLTEWHKQHFDEMFPIFNHLTTSFHYGIYQKPYNIESKPKTYLSKFIYSSFANRGLLHILRAWQKIRDIIPEATLTIYSDINHDWVLKNYPREMAEIKKILEKLQAKPNQSGIIYRGWVNKNELSRGWSNADIWLYPCVFSETFCHTALEAAVSKTLVISNHLAALKNTVDDRGLILKQNIHSQKWEDELIDTLKNINQPSYYFETVLPLIEKNYKWACEHIWENRAQEFLDKYISPNVLEYRNMYNWTSDIPVGSKNIMEQIVINEMEKFSHPKILEIGSWSGTSIIGFLSLLPNGTATVVDIWDNYEEFSDIPKQNILASFLRNIKTKNLEDKITFYKNKSSVALTNLIQDREYYHLIYVDGSHENLNCYTDMVLSWSLLIQNGLMIVDDYPLVSIAVEKFLKDYKKSYKLIYKDLRVYIKKLTI